MNAYAAALAEALNHQIIDATTLLNSPAKDRLFIDVRLGEPEEERESFLKAHIFGAVHGQIRDCFAAPPDALSGNLPLPRPDALQKQISDWQVGEETEIIVYGPSPALAARAWWVLKWAGLRQVRILDGGLTAWMAAGGPMAQGDARPRPPVSNPVQITPGQMPDIDVHDVAMPEPGTILVDARDETSFLTGHIPGAINLPADEFRTPSGTMRSPAEIRKLFGDAAIPTGSDVIVYCGGGVLSALVTLTLTAIDAHPRLFVGSWSEWLKHPDLAAQSARHMQNHPRHNEKEIEVAK